MYSINYPNMFNGTAAKLAKDHSATYQNLALLLKTALGSSYGDPALGTNLKKMIYMPNSVVLRDLVADEIYTAIIKYIPQIKVERKNIVVTADKQVVNVSITCINLIDYQVDNYSIELTKDGEN